MPALPKRHGAERIARFALVGGIGFFVDVGALAALHDVGGVDPFSARLVSTSAAALVTWRLNRAMTFGASPASQSAEALRYGLVAFLAAALNYALYAGLLLLEPRLHPVAAVVAATLIAMSFSYLGYSRWVFQGAGARSAVSGVPRSQSR